MLRVLYDILIGKGVKEVLFFGIMVRDVIRIAILNSSRSSRRRRRRFNWGFNVWNLRLYEISKKRILLDVHVWNSTEFDSSLFLRLKWSSDSSVQEYRGVSTKRFACGWISASFTHRQNCSLKSFDSKFFEEFSEITVILLVFERSLLSFGYA